MTNEGQAGGARGEGPTPSAQRGGRSPARVLVWLLISVVLLFIVLMTASGQGGIVEVQDDQVAVIVDYMTGEMELVTHPGYQVFVPFVKQAFLFNKSPLKFTMRGKDDQPTEPSRAPELTVRANDGSNFYFEDIEIQYQLMPSEAAVVLSDSGPGEGFKRNWVQAFARSILRDEFGKFSASEIADPTIYKGATTEARERLNTLLEPHGVHVLQIITPKPRFAERYEQAIEERKVADQMVERIKAQAIQLERERERRLAEIEREKRVEFEELLGTLEKQRIEAEREQIRVQKSADAYATSTVARGHARRSELVERARGLGEKARKEAEGLRAIIDSLALDGEVLVRERLAQRLGEVEFTLVPYTRDPFPERLELEGLVPAGLGQPVGRGAAAAEPALALQPGENR